MVNGGGGLEEKTIDDVWKLVIKVLLGPLGSLGISTGHVLRKRVWGI